MPTVGAVANCEAWMLKQVQHDEVRGDTSGAYTRPSTAL
ncbi:MAG: hypothetical protein RIQ75_2392 [Pseudomonadota bacterium]